MSVRKKMIVRTALDVLLLILGVVVLSFFLNSTQTRLAIERQEDNFKTKLDIAQQRMNNNTAEAVENLESYDDFSQAKLDSVGSFLDDHPDYARTAEMAKQWGLDAFVLIDANGRATFSAGALPDLSAEPYVSLLSTQAPVTQGDTRYYIYARSGGGYAVGGRSYTEEQKKLEQLSSPKRALETIKVGAQGFILATDPSTQTFAYAPQISLIGQASSVIGFDASGLTDGQEGWLTFEGRSYYARSRLVNGYLFTAMVPGAEMNAASQSAVTILLILFAAALALIVAYALILRRDEATNPLSAPEYIELGKHLYFNKTMGAKMRNVAIICLIAIFGFSYYTQMLSALSRQSVISENKLEAVQEILEDNDARIAALTEEYAKEYTGRAQNVAWTLAEDPTLVSDEALARIAEKAQVSAIYAFNARGKVVATNSAYKDFALGEDESDQSYPFWSVVKGYTDALVQDAQPDDTPERNLVQYVGVKRLDDKGMVQLGLMPRRLKSRLATAQQDYVLRTIAVENGGFLFAVSKEDGSFLTFPKTKYSGRPASEYGLTAAAMKDEFSGYQTIDGTECFVTCAEYGDVLLYTAVPLSSIFRGLLNTAVVVTFGSLIIVLILCAFLLLSRKMNEAVPEEKPAHRDGASLSRRFFRVVTPNGKSRVVQSAASRWSGGAKWGDLNSEQKLTRILGIMLGAAALALVVWMATGAAQTDSIFSYILGAKWEKTPNIFSLTYILLIAVEVLVVATILRKLVLYATGHFGARSETVGRLLDSFIKYVAVIGILFYGLNFIGIDSATLMTSAGILALVVGLGAQKLIGDILAGMFIVFEGEFRVGDIVTVGDWCGTVLEIGIRTTKIQRGGDIKIISNSAISGVVNMTKQYSYASADIGIEYEESLERVESVLNRELPLVKDRVPAILSGPFYKGVASLSDSAVIITIVAQCREKDRAQLGRDLNRELKLICDRNNINIPYPQIVVNRPVAHEDATRAEKREAAAFVEEQKELTKDIPAQE